MKRLFILFNINKIFSIMLVLFFVLIGLISCFRLSAGLLPDLEKPGLTILTRHSGMSPSAIEHQITIPLENEISGMPGIINMYSISEDNSSRINIEYDYHTDMQKTSAEIREIIDRVSADFSREAEKPVLIKYDPLNKPVMIFTLQSLLLNNKSLRYYADKELRYLLEKTDGISEVFISGGDEREISVLINKEKLQAYNLSPRDVITAVQYNNLNLPTGKIIKNRKEITGYIIGRYTNLNDIRKTLIKNIPGKGIIRVKDIASVKDFHKKNDSISRINSKEKITIYIRKAGNANSLSLSRNVKSVLKELKRNNINYEIIYNESEQIEKALKNLGQSLIFSGLFASLILFFFIRSFKVLFIILLSIPVSIMPSFFLMYMSDININVMSLAGTALGIGMLLDCSIIIIEILLSDKSLNLRDKVRQLISISQPLTASTLTTIIIFFPLLFINKNISLLYKDLAYTVIFVISLSLVFSLVITPVLFSMLKIKNFEIKKNNINLVRKYNLMVVEKYKIILYYFIFNKTAYKGIIFIFFFISIMFLMQIRKEYFEPFETNNIVGYLELPAGTTLERTSYLSKIAEQMITNQVNDIDTIQSRIEQSRTIFTIKLKSKTEINQQIQILKKKFNTFYEGFIYFTENQPGIQNNKEIPIEITGDDINKLIKYVENVSKILYSIDTIDDIIFRFKEGRPAYTLKLDQNKAAFLGISCAAAGESLRESLYGPIATKYIENNREVDVRVKYSKVENFTVEQLKNLYIKNTNSALVPLSSFTAFHESREEMKIWRKNKKRIISLTLRLKDKNYQHALFAIKNLLDNFYFEPGYNYNIGGNYKNFIQSKKELIMGIFFSIFLIYLVLASLYQNYSLPIIIIRSVPFSFAGVFIILFTFNMSLSVPVYIGLIILTGMVINNAIVLLDSINKNILLVKHKTLSDNLIIDEIMRSAISRLRPILLTTITTLAGLLPVLFISESGSNFFKPVAVTLFCGLFFSLFSTLIIIPLAARNYWNKFIRL